MSEIEITILGAGQDVGRSCIVVTFPSRRIILDCGAHCGFVDHRRYPALHLLGDSTMYNHHLDILMATKRAYDESEPDEAVERFTMDNEYMKEQQREEYLNKAACMKDALKQALNDVTNTIDCAIISHFHLDHVGALPFLTEHLGYKGPVYMTYPTKALSPILLRDSVQVVASRCYKSTTDTNVRSVRSLLNREQKRRLMTPKEMESMDPWGYTSESVMNSLYKSIPMQLRSTTRLSNISITPYYAGHVLGAAMYCVECDDFSVVYTGDFNTIPDKHLGPAKIPPLNPDVLICESTYATVVRQSRRATEMELCTTVHDCLMSGGKVLIPVFAVGRAQELAIILDNYWNKLQINYPIYFGGGLSERATNYYKLHSSWTNSNNIPNLYENQFSLSHVVPFDNSYLNDQRPMVLFATPGMVHAGLSLRACKMWGPNPKNLILIPGYCVQGTIGNKLISGEKVIQTSSGPINIKCKVRYLSFSAHADSAGIIQIVKQIQPKNVILVHGEYDGMKKFSKHLKSIFNLPVYYPANGQSIKIKKQFNEQLQDVYLYPELLIESSGLKRADGNNNTSIFGLIFDGEDDKSERFNTFALLYDDASKLVLISKDILLKSKHSQSIVHCITHSCTISMSLEKFIKVTEFIAKLSRGFINYENDGVKSFQVSSLVLRYSMDKVYIQWDNNVSLLKDDD